MPISTACWRFLLAATAVVGLALSAGAPPAVADQVSGNVTLDGRPVSNDTLVISLPRNGRVIEVQISDRGFYRVFLEPGSYRVSLKSRRDVPPLILNSDQKPVVQHLAFGRR